MGLKELMVKRLNKELPVPEYKSEGAVGLDLVSREDVVIPAMSFEIVPLNVVVKIPDGYVGLLFPRSSLFKKKRLLMTNSVGVIDKDYCGDEDEIKACMLYLGLGKENSQKIECGERVCQLLIMRADNFEIVEQDTMGESRGGFGSTGGYADG